MSLVNHPVDDVIDRWQAAGRGITWLAEVRDFGIECYAEASAAAASLAAHESAVSETFVSLADHDTLVAEAVAAERNAHAEALDLLAEMVAQHASTNEAGVYDSDACAATRDAMEFLIRVGRMEKVGRWVGRRAFARFVERKEKKA